MQNKRVMSRLIRSASIFFLLALWVVITPVSAAASRFQFWGVSHLHGFKRLADPKTGRQTLTSARLSPAGPWDELIASWNADVPPASALEVQARAVSAHHSTRWYSLGYWAGPGHVPPRTSRTGQTDADGHVDTDTLVLKRPAQSFQIRLVMDGPVDVRFLGVSLTDRHGAAQNRPPNTQAWGRVLSVPQISQLAYPHGEGWCSPASVSMTLAYWTRQNNNLLWYRPVPKCAAGIYDKARDGTGNWPFNTAYAGGLPGLRAYVTRLADVRALEDWIAEGVPVVLAVSVSLRAGDDRPGPNGHLVVCTGFTPQGDLIVNDPWTHLERGQSVRRVVPRVHLAALWAKSEHTVYIIHPLNLHPSQEITFQ